MGANRNNFEVFFIWHNNLESFNAFPKNVVIFAPKGATKTLKTLIIITIKVKIINLKTVIIIIIIIMIRMIRLMIIIVMMIIINPLFLLSHYLYLVGV